MTPTKNATTRLIGLIIVLLGLGATQARAQVYTIMPQPFGLVQDNSGHIVNGGCVWTYTAGTTTAATTYSDNAGTPNTNPIKADSAGRFTAFLVVGQTYKFVYENVPCTVSPPVHGSVLRTADNIAAIPASANNVDVTGTAGETLSAGNCAYLSDGSGGKNPAQWYKCDSGNAYSSTQPETGLVPTAIASGASGSIRLLGAVTGLSSLSVGAEYYVGSAGALTTTAPANRRHLGHADSATSMVLTADPPPVAVTFGFVNDFRLSLTTATCVTTSDVTAATTLFLTPCTGNRITLFNGSGVAETCSTAEVSIAIPATTSQMYDVWAYDSTFGTCTVTLELLAWTNDTTRATAIARSNGRWTKSGDTTRLFVGNTRTTTVSGQTEDSLLKRYVWNYYNRVPRLLQRFETTTSWTWNSNTIRQANAAAANQVDAIIGVAEVMIDLTIQVPANVDVAGNVAEAGIGLDSTTTFASNQTGIIGQSSANTTDVNILSHYQAYVAVGRHVFSWNEAVQTGTTTYQANNLGASRVQSGILGWIQG